MKQMPESIVNAIRELAGEGIPLERIANGLSVDLATVQHYSKSPYARYEAFGELKSLEAWAKDERCCVCINTLRKRFKVYKWDLERALTEPSKHAEAKGKKDAIVQAIANGIPAREIATRFGVSLPTAYNIKKKQANLPTIASKQPAA